MASIFAIRNSLSLPLCENDRFTQMDRPKWYSLRRKKRKRSKDTKQKERKRLDFVLTIWRLRSKPYRPVIIFFEIGENDARARQSPSDEG